MGAQERIVYVSYAHEDEKLVDELMRHLRVLERTTSVRIWPDRSLGAGDDWNAGLQSALEAAEVVLVLLSASYLSGEFTFAEMEHAIARARAGKLRIIPVVLRDVHLRSTPLADIQAFPADGRPVVHRGDRDQVFAELTAVVLDILDELAEPPQVGGDERQAVSPQVGGDERQAVSPQVGGDEREAVSPPDLSDVQPEVSMSVREAVKDLEGAVPASAIVVRLLTLHPDYGAGAGRSMDLGAVSGARSRTISDWLTRVRALYSEDVVPMLDGRLVIRGLALLEPTLTKQLLDQGFLAAIEGELEMPIDAALTPEGHRLWEPGDVPTLADRPARTDRLRRDHFARGLAEMIEEERTISAAQTGVPESFLVHLHGPWGSGKTSLLGFVAEGLRGSESRWVVVQFNAWQHERLGTPWWSLMTAVHRAGMGAPFSGAPKAWLHRDRWRDMRRALRLLWFDVAWRVRLGWMAYLLLPFVLGLLWFGWREGFFDAAASDDGWLVQAGDIAKPVGAIIGLVVALFGAARGLNRSLAAGSARGAEAFMRTSRDPMRTLRRRYERLVATIERPVAVFIDDLGRCQSTYVVEVLQGVQTLLIEAPVTYVVAADRRWLYDSYAKVYADFRSVARVPGRPLGHLFLEKTFQLSAAVPQLAPDIRDEYWSWLIAPRRQDEIAEEAQLAERAESRAASAGLDEVVSGGTNGSLAEERAEREALSSRISDADVREEIQSRLQPFSGLLESNPRAMKRLINAYRIELRRLLAEGRRIGAAAVTPEQIALWTIVSLRWPLLADELALEPGLLAGTQPSDMRLDLRRLLASDDVQAVLRGDGVSARLTPHAVRALVGLPPPRQAKPLHPPVRAASDHDVA